MAPMPAPPPEPQQPMCDADQAHALARGPAQAFFHGMLQSVPLLIVTIPFGILFGVVATDAGFDIAQILGFSALVLAGASQFTVVQLLSDNAPVWLVILSGLAVNLRMAMYSASLVPWVGKATGAQKILIAYALIDQNYAISIQHYERNPRLSLTQRLAYFFGAAVPLCGLWIVGSFAGATLGQAIPASIPLDFAVPITFLAMFAPMLRTPAHLAACFVAFVSALLFSGLTSGLGLLIAAPLGMATGAMVETWTEKHKMEVQA